MIDKEEEFIRMAAYGSGDLDSLKAILRDGVDVNCQVNASYASKDLTEGMTALSAAIQNYQLHIAEFLLEHGANPEIKDIFGYTTMHTASFMDDAASVALLANYRVDVNVKDNNGKTPLYCALNRMGVEFDVVRVLIEHGADIFVEDDNGVTPYDLITKNRMAMDDETVSLIRAVYEEKALIGVILDNGKGILNLDF